MEKFSAPLVVYHKFFFYTNQSGIWNVGLEYLHDGCQPPIIHRDVKSANILLNEKLQAKLADMELCRSLPIDDLTDISTEIVGTYGYLDPE